jgi:hypothetical protein
MLPADSNSSAIREFWNSYSLDSFGPAGSGPLGTSRESENTDHGLRTQFKGKGRLRSLSSAQTTVRPKVKRLRRRQLRRPLSDSTDARPLEQKGPPFGDPDVWYPKRDSPLSGSASTSTSSTSPEAAQLLNSRPGGINGRHRSRWIGNPNHKLANHPSFLESLMGRDERRCREA